MEDKKVWMTAHRLLFVGGLALAIPGLSASQTRGLPDCEWCGATEAPDDVRWQTVIPNEDEPGQWMKISGQVFKSDGKTPADGVILYVYHTNAKGLYERRGDETGNGRRHGYLRGWMKTNAQGEYQFKTIKPGAYPNRREAAHVHITVLEPGKEEYWIDSFTFADDPLLTDRDRHETGVITLKEGPEGVLVGTRDIVLPERE